MTSTRLAQLEMKQSRSREAAVEPAMVRVPGHRVTVVLASTATPNIANTSTHLLLL